MTDKNTEIQSSIPKSELIKALGVALCTLLAAGCGTSKPVDAVITKVVDDKSAMGCIGTDKRTILKTADGFITDICGEYGQAGDKVRGYWREGAWDGSLNGFRLSP